MILHRKRGLLLKKFILKTKMQKLLGMLRLTKMTIMANTPFTLR